MRQERRVIDRFICVLLVVLCASQFTSCSLLFMSPGDSRFYQPVASAKELFDKINGTLYRFENEVDIKTDTYDTFMGYWNELDGQVALHSAFRSQDVKIKYKEKDGECKIRLMMELNACGQAMQYLYTKSVDEYPSKEAEEVGKQLLSIQKEIISPDMEDEAIVRAIHDYIISHYKYAVNGKATDYASTEVLIEEGQGQCQAYSEMFVALCLLSGVQAIVISGRSTFGFGEGSHAWCQVKVSHIWYHVDPTWDDPIPDEPHMIRYDFYLKGDMTMDFTHDWSPYFEECILDYNM